MSFIVELLLMFSALLAALGFGSPTPQCFEDEVAIGRTCVAIDDILYGEGN
jgi:hypothetical protein